MKIIFFLYHFNDVDHITPVIWKCLQKGDSVTAVMLNPRYDIDSDPRLRFLRNFKNFDLQYIHLILAGRWAKWIYLIDGPRGMPALIRRKLRGLLRRCGFSLRRAEYFLQRIRPDASVFEWGGWGSRGRIEFFLAVKKQGIRKVCLPHGLNIYLNIDVTTRMKEHVQAGRLIRASNNQYDAYVFQSRYHSEQDIKLGISPKICHVLGSARYYPDWQKIQESFYSAFEPKHDTAKRLKVVFMLPHWEYNVKRIKTLKLIASLVKQDWIYLVVRDHTRGAGSLPEEMRRGLSGQTGFEVTASASSVSLIRWSDAVINFGSSIGIEALLQNKHLINPFFLHTNTTIFDKTAAAMRIGTMEDVVKVLEKIRDNKIEPISQENKQKLYRTVIYGGQDNYDVLQAYRAVIAGYPVA